MTELQERVADVTLLPAQRVDPSFESTCDEPDLVIVEDEVMTAAERANRYLSSHRELEELLRRERPGGVRAVQSDAELRPWQVELLKLQHFRVSCTSA